MKKIYDCIVIGAGHAGVEAGLAPARMGCSTLMVTLHFNTIGQMSCNPAIGGVGKGQLVKEIDALGGEMGLAADRTGIQFRQLNTSKGQAVRSSRCQSDRKLYREYMQEVVRNQSNLDVLESKVSSLIVEDGKIQGVTTEDGDTIKAKTVIITTGTFLKGRMHMGQNITQGGRIGEQNSVTLADSINALGFPVMMFKTGTPPRLDGKTIDFSKLEAQHSDDIPVPFSFRTKEIPKEQKLLPCHITYTTEDMHQIILDNMDQSPMYSGQIDATGVRYCPSIEDKLKKFEGKSRHHVFLEPEGLDTDEYYPNGISTGLPKDIQEQFIRAIPGLENVKITQYGYAIEHGVIPATELYPTMETRKVKGLFFAGQVNGTTGYEEAGAQGLMAGINAALQVQGKESFILRRDEAYIGVLLDDLTTKQTEEPYRMFTSRVEYRLIVREDNADRRLAHYGHQFGLLSDNDMAAVENKYEIIAKEVAHLRDVRIAPGTELDKILEDNDTAALTQSTTLGDILKRPQVSYAMIAPFDGTLKEQPQVIINQVEYEIKYEGFIKRQLKDVDKFKHIEKIKLPEGINYNTINGLSIEVRQKLDNLRPLNLGQANRISGITPAAISVLMVYLRKVNPAHV
ncbi:MAG: tRNA uridine 5-carboxymethylaminomethyl modification enzyme [Candidatus Omnitrophota bacterium]|jgi:tRNA uridine 5-carboxymethylaminomethyl modification enzyme